jgi:uncharacterized membrane protein YfcA
MLGLGIGFTMGMTGIGAGVLVIPSLIYIIGLSPVNAVGTGLLYSMLTRVHGICEHLRLRTVRKRTGFYIILGGVPAVLVTSLIITHLAKTMGSGLDLVLKVAISIVMLVTWTLMLVGLLKNRKDGSKNYYAPLKHFPLRRKLYGIAAGACVGTLIGSTSIGGGVLIIPILVTVFRLSPNNTVGTSMLIAIVMSAVGSFAYLLRGDVSLAVAVTMFVGAVPGVFMGCRLSVKVPHRVLAGILFAVITIGVIVMFAGIGK